MKESLEFKWENKIIIFWFKFYMFVNKFLLRYIMSNNRISSKEILPAAGSEAALKLSTIITSSAINYIY